MGLICNYTGCDRRKRACKCKYRLYQLWQTLNLKLSLETKLTDRTANSLKLKDGKWCEVRFTRDVTELPVAYSELICESENVNFDRRNKYPICWIKGVVSIKQLERPVEDMTQYFEEVNE